MYVMGSRLRADGALGGGTILVGGGRQGGDATVANATTLNVGLDSLFTANATTQGNGGTVVLWAEGVTQYFGQIEAQGGAWGGDGGYLEVSGREGTRYGGSATAAAPAGQAGTLLLDPKNITVAAVVPGSNPILLEFVDPHKASGNGFGTATVTLSNGNVVITAPTDDFSASNAGAAYLFNGGTGALISTLRGSTANDFVGNGSITVLSNGNYVVRSPYWNGSRGAVTWGSEASGVSGAVSVSNSLVGSSANDKVGLGFFTILSNGNYVVSSYHWNGNRGAVTWGSGTSGIVGTVSATNSLVGSTANDQVGNASITVLSNDNYVVWSQYWDNGSATDAGAVTWGSGTSGITGAVSAANSLVGSTANDQVGFGGITALSNGNYVVNSYYWDNGLAADAGAVTWGSGTAGVSGVVSAANSLVGSTASDYVGIGGITVLNNGNYVVRSSSWDNGTATNAGAVTWGSGTSGVSGVVSASNSLVGSTSNDQVGVGGTYALSNGNYVVLSYPWDNGGVANVGAVTWGNGTIGITGAVSAVNSLVGSSANDEVGFGGISILSNGNYVVNSYLWNNGAATTAGAATWANGTTGITGVVSAANSLVGSNSGDNVGRSGIQELTNNGNYVVKSPYWSNGRGAVTWVSGVGTTTGVVSSANSLVGSVVGDNVGAGGITPLSSGNYLVNSYYWSNGAATDAGAVTWADGTTGITGTVSASNSLVGSTANDQVGGGGIMVLSNGNYVVNSYYWNGSQGAVTWGSGTAGITGAVSSSNSLVGSTTTDQVGYGGITALSNGNYVVRSTSWDNGAATDAGAVTWGSGTAGVSGVVSASNSIVGGSANASLQPIVVDTVNGTFIASFASDTSGGAGGRVYAGSINGLSAPSSPSGLLFGDNPADSITIAASSLTDITNTGTAVILQASNDITINAAITSNNGSGDGGTITLQAGRSILLNANITTDNGNLTMVANETLANGVVDAQRDAGNAAITMAAGTSINAGSGTVSITLADGAGKTNSSSGDITLNDLSASTITVLNRGSTAGSDIVLNGTLTASGTGDAIRLAGDAIINNTGATALSAASGRWLVFANQVSGNTFGGLLSGNQALWNVSDVSASITPTGNRYVFAQQPTLTFTSMGEGKTYGDNLTASIADNFTVSGYIDASIYGGVFTQDTLANSTSGTAVASSVGAAATASVAGSPYSVLLDLTAVSTTTGYALAKSETGLITVAQRAITLTPDAGQSKVYGNADPALTYTVGGLGLVNGDTLSGALSRAAGENVGNYAINQGTLAASSNYSVSFTNGVNFGITQRAITISANIQSKTYGDTFTFNGTEFTVFGTLVNGDTVTSATIGSAGAVNTATVAGSPYGVTISGATGTGLGNYNISYVGGSMTVNQRAITLTPDAGQSKAYGNADPSLTYAVGGLGLVNGDTLSGALGRAAGENVGNYAINQGTLAASSNYNVSFTSGVNFGITQRAITLTPDAGQGKVYGNVDPTLTYAVGGLGLVNGDTLSGALGRAAGENVGNYAINQGTLAASSNYSVSFTSGVNFGITQRAITISANIQSKTYGDTFTFNGTEFTVFGTLVNGDTVTSATIGSAGAVNTATVAGSPYGVTISGATGTGLGNYNISYVGGSMTVNQRAITLTPDAGQSKVYGNADPALTYTVGGLGLVNGDTLSGALGRAAGENVGNYAINQGTVTGDGNYNVSFTSGVNFGITQRAITLTPDAGQSKVYGNADPTLTYTVGGAGLAFADTLSGALGRAAGENVGNYAINQGTVTGDGNYNVSFTSGTNFGITQRPLSITSDNASRSEGQANPAFSASYLGFAPGEGPGDLLGSLNLTTTAVLASTPGNYPITPSGQSSTNYAINFVDGTLTVTGTGPSYSASWLASLLLEFDKMFDRNSRVAFWLDEKVLPTLYLGNSETRFEFTPVTPTNRDILHINSGDVDEGQ